MSYFAKPILKDKFWILEENNIRVGTISWNEDRFVVSNASGTHFFKNKKQLTAKYQFLVWGKDQPNTTKKSFDVYGFPTSVEPNNPMYDVKRKLPLFTKSNNSKSIYCAGYYIIQFEKGWVKSFCPKLITIERYPFKGPYKNEFIMKQELSRVAN